jgi:hypothetical protein
VLHNIPEERKAHLLRVGILKWRKKIFSFTECQAWFLEPTEPPFQ